ncbi:hypothetical protein [Pseudomaricurvus sp. HS19]|uniref:hypothetical protein n=1 Tax=Pseudomaricurvus sp. HS19 TaxID=2692626 RepID=UPI0013706060|nr:hypothetical protein [Pseudomaricurvus sp. HS19]MYM62772.1 hypothetical protein [Pseudomaricurvus sp. HS19]
MKTFTLPVLLVLLLPCLAQAEDDFPSYLSPKYCTDVKLDFMTSSMKSLRRYRDSQLASRHRGGMNNIRTYLMQRQEWLLECDSYLQATRETRLFKDDATSANIFNAIESVSSELQSLIAGVSYSVEPGGEITDVASQKFDRLFKLVDDHQTLLMMRGQFVAR